MPRINNLPRLRIRQPITKVTNFGRICTGCSRRKYWKNFSLDHYGVNGRKAKCKICCARMSARWKAKTDYYAVNRDAILEHKRKTYCPIRKKSYDLGRKYNLTLQEFERLFLKQKGKCKTCQKRIKKFSTSKKKQDGAVVDHCHRTGRIRGLLCHTCNRAIGLLNDDIKLVARIIRYLKT